MLSRRITAENSIADLLSRVFYKQFVKKKKKRFKFGLTNPYNLHFQCICDHVELALVPQVNM